MVGQGLPFLLQQTETKTRSASEPYSCCGVQCGICHSIKEAELRCTKQKALNHKPRLPFPPEQTTAQPIGCAQEGSRRRLCPLCMPEVPSELQGSTQLSSKASAHRCECCLKLFSFRAYSAEELTGCTGTNKHCFDVEKGML